MCGITGTNTNAIIPMTVFQEHRGPDNTSVLEFEGFSFGHNRLSILDLSENSNQPVDTGRYVFTYNGEIYNFKDFGNYASDTLMLKVEIEKKGLTTNLLRSFNGMFSIAVWDKIERELKIAIDPFGQKPCYYYHNGNEFSFASSPGSLTCLKDKWTLDLDGLKSLFVLGSVMGERSLFYGIKRLMGSQILTFKDSTVSVSKWWDIDAEASSGMRELLFDAIDKTKVSDVPVHIFLSGGIDSSLVASRFVDGKAIHLQSEELSYARIAAQKNNITLEVCPVDFLKSLVLTKYASKTGDCAMSAAQPYLVSEQVQMVGKVAITANGADELFFGYPRTMNGQLRHIFRPGYEPYLDELKSIYGMNTPREIELRCYVQHDLNKTLDFASMCNSVEVRSPFLDTRLVNAALSIPHAKHVAKYGSKTILKEILLEQGYSMSFINRPKLGFSLPKQDHSKEFDWCGRNGFMKQDWVNWSPRDRAYINATASSFYYWYKVWKSKLN